MKIKFAPLGLGFLLFFVSCDKYGTAENNESLTSLKKEATSDYQFQAADTSIATVAEDGVYQQDQPSAPKKQPAPNPDWDKKIIKTGTVSLEVEDYSKYYALLRESVRKTGGYLASENQNRTEYRLENTVTVKVPVAQFDEAITLLTSATGKEKVHELKVTSQDVTGEVVDTKSRIEAKRQVRLRYMELLQQAKKMEDILLVQNEINEIQEEIEMGAGRVNYLNHASAYSTIELTFYQTLTNAPQPNADPSFITRLWDAFERGWTFIKNIIIGLITVWPLWIAALGVVLAIRKFGPKANVKV
jgi:Domain of unknown function (DUF4349)